MDLLNLLAVARDGALHPDDPIELTARLADQTLGEAVEERRALIEVLLSGYPGALAVGDTARAERIAGSLVPTSPLGPMWSCWSLRSAARRRSRPWR